MPMAMSDLLNFVLQLDAGDRDQARIDLQKQQANLGNLNQYIQTLSSVRDPQQLTQVQQFFAQSGVPLPTLQNISDQYLPEISQLQRAAASAGVQGMTPEQSQSFNQAAANNLVTGQGAGTNAAQSALAETFGDSSVFTPAAKRGQLFSAIGFDPAKQAMSDAVAGVVSRNPGQVGAIQTGLAMSAGDLASLQLRRDEFQTQAELASRQFNRGIFEGDRGYALNVEQLRRQNEYTDAQIAALKAKAEGKTPASAQERLDALKELNKISENLQRGGMTEDMVEINRQMIQNLLPSTGIKPPRKGQAQNNNFHVDY